jgi:hypothetical protein
LLRLRLWEGSSHWRFENGGETFVTPCVVSNSIVRAPKLERYVVDVRDLVDSNSIRASNEFVGVSFQIPPVQSMSRRAELQTNEVLRSLVQTYS